VNSGLIVGIDVGGTKTHVLVNRQGTTAADEVVLTESWRTWRVDEDAARLAALVRRLCDGLTPDSLAMGAHGCDSDQECRQMEDALSISLGSPVKVVNDAELMAPAAGHLEGIGVVAGTGSIAVARGRDGQMLAAGGWGWILGDEGSAPALLREAARAVRNSIDNDRFDDPLIDILLGEFHTAEATKLGRLLNEVRGAASWGSHADAVFRAARAGSPLARKVIDEGGRALANLVATLVKRGADPAIVVAGGGVITEQPTLMEAFKAGMATISASSEILLLSQAPVVGAIALAKQILRRAGAH
jgi:glucosamine kinase